MRKLFPIILSMLLCIAVSMSYASGKKTNSEESFRASEDVDSVRIIEAEDTVASSIGVAADAFVLIPDADLDLLTQTMRMHMMIYMDADSVYKQNNIYSGESWIEKMTPNYISVHLTDVSNIVLKHLDCPKLKANSLIMSIYTITGDSNTADSTIKFYEYSQENDTTTVRPLPAKQFFRFPKPSDFFILKKGGMSSKDLETLLPFHTVEYSISETGDTLTGRPTIANYLTQEERKKVEPYLVKKLQWKWDGKKFDFIK